MMVHHFCMGDYWTYPESLYIIINISLCVCAVPCVPQQVEARVVCESGAVAVSWEPSKGASSYTAVAQGNGGYASKCNSSQTTCLFNDLLCGLNYSITVSASDETCRSAGSSAVELNTGRINIQL